MFTDSNLNGEKRCDPHHDETQGGGEYLRTELSIWLVSVFTHAAAVYHLRDSSPSGLGLSWTLLERITRGEVISHTVCPVCDGFISTWMCHAGENSPSAAC